MAQTIKRTIKPGTKFLANSFGKLAHWVVTKRIKTNDRNLVYCKVTKGKAQTRKYTGKQFGMLIGMKVIQLKKA